MRVSPEVDALLWAIAEEPSEAAVQEFHARYPEHAGELARRMGTVRALRAAGRPVARRTPRFTPRPARRPASRPVMAWALGMAAFAALASAATVYTFVRGPHPAPAPTVAVAPPRVETPPIVTRREPAPVEPKPFERRKPPVEEPVPAYLKPTSVTMKGVGLSTAIQAIAAQGGLKVTVAPGMPDVRVNVDYRDRTTIEILQDLGRLYAFTPFDQGDGSVLVIPARDETAENPARKTELPSPVEATGGSGREPSL